MPGTTVLILSDLGVLCLLLLLCSLAWYRLFLKVAANVAWDE